MSANSQTVVVRDHPRSAAAEAYRMIRANMAFMDAAGGAGLWLFTSAVAAEGKSITVANLSLTLAATGRRTLIIDADLRRPTQHHLFATEQSPGLSHVLTGRDGWADCVQNVAENLDLITSGPLPPNPAELLQTSQAHELLSQVRDHYETVLIDAPPVLMVADSQLLAQHCDQVVLVVKAGFTRKDALKEAHQTLVRSGAKQMAVILNQMRPSQGYGGYAQYYAYYGSE